MTKQTKVPEKIDDKIFPKPSDNWLFDLEVKKKINEIITYLEQKEKGG